MSHRLGWPPFCDPVWCEWVLCPCGQKFQRLAGETCVTCLSCQTAERLTAAGIEPGDPALVTIRAFNAEAQRKAGTRAEPAA
jgi:hypothetical protein